MISDAEMRAVCAKALTQKDPQRQEEFLFALRAACAQYVRERSIFLAQNNSSPYRVSTPKIANGRKRAA
jgi:hypothetical protein